MWMLVVSVIYNELSQADVRLIYLKSDQSRMPGIIFAPLMSALTEEYVAKAGTLATFKKKLDHHHILRPRNITGLIYRVVQKTDTQFYFWDNFGHLASILTILSLSQAEIYGA